jgi:hypothetical protein
MSSMSSMSSGRGGVNPYRARDRGVKLLILVVVSFTLTSGAREYVLFSDNQHDGLRWLIYILATMTAAIAAACGWWFGWASGYREDRPMGWCMIHHKIHPPEEGCMLQRGHERPHTPLLRLKFWDRP